MVWCAIPCYGDANSPSKQECKQFTCPVVEDDLPLGAHASGPPQKIVPGLKCDDDNNSKGEGMLEVAWRRHGPRDMKPSMYY